MRVVCAAMILRNHRSTRSESLLDRAGSSISVRVLDQGRPRSLDPDRRLPEKSGFDLLCGKKPEVLQLHRFSDSETVRYGSMNRPVCSVHLEDDRPLLQSPCSFTSETFPLI